MHMYAYACLACIFHSLREPILGDPTLWGEGGNHKPGTQDIYAPAFAVPGAVRPPPLWWWGVVGNV